VRMPGNRRCREQFTKKILARRVCTGCLRQGGLPPSDSGVDRGRVAVHVDNAGPGGGRRRMARTDVADIVTPGSRLPAIRRKPSGVVPGQPQHRFDNRRVQPSLSGHVQRRRTSSRCKRSSVDGMTRKTSTDPGPAAWPTWP